MEANDSLQYVRMNVIRTDFYDTYITQDLEYVTRDKIGIYPGNDDKQVDQDSTHYNQIVQVRARHLDVPV